MAKRPAWSVQDDVVICENFDFMWSGGFSITQKQKNIRALHQSIYEMKHEKALEVSSKSEVRVGKEIGAFSLELDGIFLENVFQAAKQYEWFTDIEFNPQKSINCQARAVAIYVALQKTALFNSLKSKDSWITFHERHVKG